MTKYINLKDFNTPKMIITDVTGKEHKMKPMSTQDFMTNAEEAGNLKADPKISDELNLVITMLSRSFPTMKIEDFKVMPFEALTAILDVVKKINSGETEDKIAGEVANSGDTAEGNKAAGQ